MDGYYEQGGTDEIILLLSEDVRHSGGVGVIGEDPPHIGAVEVDFCEDFGLGADIGKGVGAGRCGRRRGQRGCGQGGERRGKGRRGRGREGGGGDDEAEVPMPTEEQLATVPPRDQSLLTSLQTHTVEYIGVVGIGIF
ncbi:hypothetical protein Dimus_023048 [Dionaea muscipula]